MIIKFEFKIISLIIIFFINRFINIEPSAVDEERVASNNDNNEQNITLSDEVVAATISETLSEHYGLTNASTSSQLSTNIWDGLVTDPPDVSLINFNRLKKNNQLYNLIS